MLYRRIRNVALASLCLLASLGATAGESAAAPGATSKPSAARSQGLMSRDAVRECARIEADIEAVKPELQNRTAEVDAAAYDYQRAERFLDEREKQVDQGDADEVARYNELVRDYSARLKHYNDMLPAHTALVERSNALIDAFNERCTKQQYLIQEQIDARGELGEREAGEQ